MELRLWKEETDCPVGSERLTYSRLAAAVGQLGAVVNKVEEGRGRRRMEKMRKMRLLNVHTYTYLLTKIGLEGGFVIIKENTCE